MLNENVNKKTLLIRSLMIAAGLTAFKLAVFSFTNSMSLMASAVDSFMDFLVSFANFLLIQSAAKPADHNHPYGHGKIESLGGLVQSLVIGGVSIGVAGMAAKRFLEPQQLHQPLAGIAITLVAMALNLWHAKNLRRSMVATNSQVMATEYLHYASDTLVYLGVFVSFVLYTLTGALFWDPLISLLIVIYLLKSVAAIFHETLTELMDVQLPDQQLREIDSTIRAFDQKIADYHDLRTRKVGATKFIEFHVVLRGVETFREAHRLTAGLMEALQKKYPGAVVTVHPDPE